MALRRQRTLLSRAVGTGMAVSAVAMFAACTAVFAQEAGGPLFTFGVTTTARASDNLTLETTPAGVTVLSETALSLGFESVTRTQTLRIGVSDLFRFGVGPDAPVQAGFRGINANLFYEKLWTHSRFEFGASLNTRDLDGDLTEADLDEPDDLIIDSGTLTTTNLNLAFETGLTAPIGAEVALSDSRRMYSGTTDPELEDSRTLKGELALILRFSPVTETRLSYSHTLFEAEDASGTERETRSLSATANHQLSPIARLNASVGWIVIDRRLTAVPLTLPQINGMSAALGYARDLPAGSFAVDLSHDVTTAGGRTDLTVTRGFEFPASRVTFTLGATLPPGSGIQPTASIAFTRRLPDQSFSFSISSDIGVTSDSEVQRRTTADLAYGLDLNALESLAFGVSYSWITNTGGITATDSTRASATATYRRMLTRDWTLETGYIHRLSRGAGADTARSNEIFVTLGREFSWRPW